ncbi:MAG TPA: BolA family transcriptional regulator [Polyangiaceae bacterium]|jgi:stress-induced morphogen|nr:BolA family transcriptional regulator [Polyangiaceae bacterium]
MLEPSRIEQLIREGLPDAVVEIQDLTGTADHFRVEVISAQFEDLKPIARHRLVYGTLGAHVGGAIHALALGTHTPDEWRRRKQAT